MIVLDNQFFIYISKDMDKDNLLLSFVVIVFWLYFNWTICFVLIIANTVMCFLKLCLNIWLGYYHIVHETEITYVKFKLTNVVQLHHPFELIGKYVTNLNLLIYLLYYVTNFLLEGIIHYIWKMCASLKLGTHLPFALKLVLDPFTNTAL